MTTGQGATHDYKLELRGARGGGVLALDDISVDLVPLVGDQYVREENEGSTGSQGEEGANPTETPTSNTTVVNQGNATEIQPTPAQGDNNPTEKVVEGTTVTGSEEVESTVGSGDIDTSLTSPTSGTIPAAACANNSTNCTEAEMVAEEKQDTSVYGYTGEVIIIIYFAILFCSTFSQGYPRVSHSPLCLFHHPVLTLNFPHLLPHYLCLSHIPFVSFAFVLGVFAFGCP